MNNTELIDILAGNTDLLTILRCDSRVEKNYLQEQLEISFPTLAKRLEALQENGILKKDLSVNTEAFYSVGISIGGAQCKLVVVDAGFHPLERAKFDKICQEFEVFQSEFFNKAKENSLYGYKCFETPDTLLMLKTYLDTICRDIIKLHENLKCPPIISVGIAFTGSIDAEHQIIIKSHNINYMENIKKQELFTPEILNLFRLQDISIIMDHNAKAAVVAEKFFLYHQKELDLYNKKDIACVYMGSGISCGLISNNSLLRGCRNLNGELGHIQVPRYPGLTDKIEGKCSCGAEACLEHLIINDVFQMSKDEFKNKTSADLLKYLSDMDKCGKKEEILKILGYYIEWMIDFMIKFLNVDLIIFSGKTTVFIDEVWKYVTMSIGRVNDAKLDCATSISGYGLLAPAVGASIMATYGICADIEWPILPENK